MRKLIALSLGLTLMTGCTPELLKSILSSPSNGSSTTQPTGQQPGGTQQPSGQPGTYPGGTAPSGQPGMYPPPPPKQFPQDCVDKFKSLDTNADKFVDTTEWANAGLAAADFTATDRNHDGVVDLTDFCDKPMDQPPPSGDPSAEPTAEPTASSDGPTECQTKFATIDTDDNASATKEEWEAAGNDSSTFDSYDADDDGQVTTEEYCTGT